MKGIRYVIIAILLLCTLAGIASATTVTQFINYQGELTDSSGNPLTGTYSITIKLYEVPSGGTVLAAMQANLPCKNGVFTTPVAIPSDFYDGRALWLGITVGSDPEMTPRQEIRPVPYAISLRPGSVIRQKDYSGSALSIYTYVPSSTAIWASSFNDSSVAILASTTGSASHAIHSSTDGSNSDGLYSSTTGPGSYGVDVHTTGLNSHGVNVSTINDYSHALRTSTRGLISNGLDVETTGTGSYGAMIITHGDQGRGIWSSTHGTDSQGVRTSTTGDSSSGFYADTEGANSNGLSAFSRGINSKGVLASSWQSYGIYAETGKSDNKYGIYTPDYLYALGVDIESSLTNSLAVHIETTGSNNTGFAATTHGEWSPAIDVTTSGPNSDAVRAHSAQGYGIYANTDVPNGYGVFTEDYIYAHGSRFPAADVAEYMPVAENVSPGTVLVIGKGGILRTSSTPYDTHVAGIVSTAPGVSLGTKESGNPDEALVAVSGRVPCKADTTNGPILEGDLLTTSSTPGYAMRASPVTIDGIEIYRPGTILGKAMGTLESGTGIIEVLVTLQ
jgi:hypothetical protein